MKIEQIYTGCLAQGAYYIQSNGEVAIIDPLREVDDYIARAEKDGAKIKYIFETHFHADFVSGHLSLAKKTGAQIVFGPTAKTNFEAVIAEDNQVFEIGNISIKVLHTPGHTMESSCYLLRDEKGEDKAIFSGDTLFLGDVGRPDLAQKSDLTEQDLAGILFDSLRKKIISLADDVIVYPGHGAGSACGKNMSKETMGTIGHEKATNYALRADMTKQDFINELIDGILPPPAYFSENVRLNIEGTYSVDVVIEKAIKPVSVADFKEFSSKKNTIILDVRHQNEFVKGHIPRSIFIGIDGGFAPWVGALIPDLKQPILLVTPEGKEKETVTRLSRVGYDNTIGYLKGGFANWKASGKDVDILDSISADEFTHKSNVQNLNILDVRKSGEHQSMYLNLKGVENFPLDFINDNLHTIDKTKTYHIHCAGGYRSVIAASILKARGFFNLVNIEGGFEELKKTGVQMSDFVCPSTIK